MKKPTFRARFIYSKYFETQRIDQSQVLIESFNGDDITGAPFYLLRELLSKAQYRSLNVNVAVHPGSVDAIKTLIEVQFPNDAKRVNFVFRHGRAYCRLLATAKYLITNVTFPTYFIKKDGQRYLQTWHGTPLKALGREMKDSPNSIGNVQRNLLMSDYLLCPSEYVFEHMSKDYMIDSFYQGSYVFADYPQNATLLDSALAERVKKELDIVDKKVVVYMPTWRGYKANAPKCEHITYLIHALCEFENRLDDDTVVLAKPHHLAKGEIQWDGFSKVLPFPENFETYQVLSAADILVTDYSSVMFDFLEARREILLYAYDEEEYLGTRSMYMRTDQLPFWRTNSTVALCDKINALPCGHNHDYLEARKQYCPFESARVASDLCQLLVSGRSDGLALRSGQSLHNGKPNILIYAGALLKNGITASLNGLINNIDSNEANYILLFYQRKVARHNETINSFPKSIKYIPIQGQQNMTLSESIFRYLYYRLNVNAAFVVKSLQHMYQRERKRICPTIEVDTVVHFTGYERQLIHILEAFDAHKVIYTHNDMMQEHKNRNNIHMHSSMMAYRSFDRIAVVRDSLKPLIARDFGIDKNKIFVVHNCNNIDAIVDGSKQDLAFDCDTLSNYGLDELNDLLENRRGPVFINVARYSPEKGQDRLIRAFLRFKHEVNANALLIIVGGHGVEYPAISELVEREANGSVVLIRSLSNPYPLIARSDVMVFSSYYEGLPMAIIEALILGVPVISTAIPGPKEFLEKGYGLLVDNSEEGIFNGLVEYESNHLSSLVPFDAVRFNEEAVQEFYRVITFSSNA